LGSLYGSILDSASVRVAGVLQYIVDAPAPVLIHCAAGKDRTGIVVGALLLAAGVEASAVVADYHLSEANVPALRKRWQAQGIRNRSGAEVPEEWLKAPAGAITPVLERIESWPGGTRGWWLDHGAQQLHLSQWQDKMRVPSHTPAGPTE
jgi:protein-tyrosine phosphatase